MRDKIILRAIGLLAGLAGGIISRWIPGSGEPIPKVVAANEFLVIDKQSNGYAVLGIDNGEPRLRFFGGDHKMKGSLGIEGGEPKLSLLREDGSAVCGLGE